MEREWVTARGSPMSQEALLNDAPGIFIVDPDRRYTTWAIWEVYTGSTGVGKYVPNVDDLVHDWDQGFFRVAAVDYTTGLSDLRPWTIKTTPTEITDEDILLGTSPGYQSEMWRVYLDTRKTPHILQVDGRLHIYGSSAEYIKIFKGTNISVNGTVISAFYDQNNSFLGENIPLELVANEKLDNRAIKAPMVGYTSVPLVDGEVVTVVAYNSAGAVVTKAKMLVDNTSLVRRTDANKKYVTGISLQSPFLSDADPALIEFPINITVGTVAMQGVVEYSDGSKSIIPVSEDGSSRFSLYGLSNYVPTIEGQTVPLTLNYVLSQDEYAYIQGPTANGSIAERYRARTIKADNAYSVKLFAYPVWRNAVDGYTLDFWLYNLDRREYYRVPRNLVEVQAGGRNFDGLDFLTLQKLSLSVNLSQIDAKYSTYRHVQTFNIALKAPGTDRRTNWTINFNPGNSDAYGEGLEAAAHFVDTNKWLLNISNGYNSKEQWLRHMFYATQPLYDTYSETEAPAPNYFAIHTKTRRTEFSIEQWNNDLQIFNDLQEGETVYIEWLRRTPSTDLMLGVSGLPLHRSN
jgi:hypothetical protein